MSDEVGFVTMAGAKATGEAPEIGVGMLGYAFMGKAHTNAYKKIPYMIYPPPAVPKLVAIAGRNEEAVSRKPPNATATRATTPIGRRCSRMTASSSSTMAVPTTPTPNRASPPPRPENTSCAKNRSPARAEKPPKCSKRSKKPASCTWWRYNYRFVPAIRLARELIESGQLGEIYHFRAVYLQEWIMDPNFPFVWRLDKNVAGSGALGDLGSHIIDLARFLVGEPRKVSAMAKTFIKQRPIPGGGIGEVTVDDAFVSLLEFENGAMGTLEASRFCAGRKNHQVAGNQRFEGLAGLQPGAAERAGSLLER